MAKHRIFNSDSFLDKIQGRESILRDFVRLWEGRLQLDSRSIDVLGFKKFLVEGEGSGKEELLEALYRVYDLCTLRGHEDLISACRDFPQYDPDPSGKLPVECLSLKVRTEHEDAFTLAYARNTLWKAERFSVFRGKESKAIGDVSKVAVRFEKELAAVFKRDKATDLVLVRQYQECAYINFIVYHEQRTTATLIFQGTKTKLRVTPTVLRPAQQDFISYNGDTGQVEIEARFQKEEEALRKCFAACCLGDESFFDGPDAANRIDLSRIAESDFRMDVDDEHSAALVELHFKLGQTHRPAFIVRSKNVLDTLEKNYLLKRLPGGTIGRAVFHITFPDDKRGKRVELAGTNSVSFKRATHAEDIFRYLKRWGVVLD